VRNPRLASCSASDRLYGTPGRAVSGPAYGPGDRASASATVAGTCLRCARRTRRVRATPAGPVAYRRANNSVAHAVGASTGWSSMRRCGARSSVRRSTHQWPCLSSDRWCRSWPGTARDWVCSVSRTRRASAVSRAVVCDLEVLPATPGVADRVEFPEARGARLRTRSARRPAAGF
jgi:hypothetical protein